MRSKIIPTRYAYNAPAPLGHPRLRRARHCTPLSQHGLAFSQPSEGFVRYKQRGSLQYAFNEVIKVFLISNSRYLTTNFHNGHEFLSTELRRELKRVLASR